MKKLLFFVIVVCILFSVSMFAQNPVRDTEDYRKLEEYRNLANEAHERGDYEKSFEYSEMAREYAASIRESSLSLVLPYRAENWRVLADKQIKVLASIGGNTNLQTKPIYDKAVSNYGSGNSHVSLARNEEEGSFGYTNNYIIAIDNFKDAANSSMTVYNIFMAEEKRTSLIRDSIIVSGDDNDQSINELIKDARNDMVMGNYDASDEKGKAALDLMARIEERYNAENMFALAAAALNSAKDMGKDSEYPSEYNEAYKELYFAQESLNSEEYDKTVVYSQNVLDIVEEIGGGTIILPMYYVVRKFPRRADSLWSIASYDFVYGNGELWRTLYNENRQKLLRPENPNLILPGQTFTIPSVKGEMRRGTYDPNRKYLILDGRLPKPDVLAPPDGIYDENEETAYEEEIIEEDIDREEADGSGGVQP